MSAGVMQRSELLDRAQTTIRRKTGLVFSPARRADLERGLLRGMHRAGTVDLQAYLAQLDAESAALDDLVAEITVGETYFLREPGQFDVIRQDVLPDLLAVRSGDRPLRVWSAGCATGEEPYSIAMVLRERGLEQAAHILGTDISRTALARARQGRYTRWSLRGVPDEVVQANFTKQGSEFALAPAIRMAVEFGYLNLAQDEYPSLSAGVWGMDLILCRNVLIYFDGDTVAQVARRLYDSLAPGGWLLLGASDPMLGDLVPCEVVVTGAGLAYRKSSGHPVRPVTSMPRWPVPLVPASAPEPASLVAHHVPPEAAAAASPRPEDVVDPDAEGDWVRRVRALATQGDLAAAGRACAGGLERHQTSAELVYLHAVLLSEAGHHAEAIAAARTALYLDCGLVVAHLTLGAALGKLGDRSGALRSFHNAERLLSSMPADAVVPASDGEQAGRLAEMVRVQLRLLSEGEPA